MDLRYSIVGITFMPWLVPFVKVHHSGCNHASDADKHGDDKRKESKDAMRAQLLDPIDMVVDHYARVEGRCRDTEPNQVMQVMHQLPRCFVIALCSYKSEA